MSGYTRNDTANNIADGNIINASDLDGEFDAVQSAFNASTGHTHDGTTGEGAPIEQVGPVQDLVITASEVKPKTTDTLDLGTNLLQFKDLYIEGSAFIDGLGESMLVDGSSSIQFRDSALAINSSADGQLDIIADTELEITAPTVEFNSDGQILAFGSDGEVTLTHVADTGLLVNTNAQLQFRDSALGINSSTDGQLDIIADTELEITAPTVELNTDGQVLAFGEDGDVTLTHVADTALTLNSGIALRFRDSGLSINSSADGQLDIDADTELELTAPTVDINASTSVNISHDLKLDSDGAILSFGENSEVTLTHVHNTGLDLKSASGFDLNLQTSDTSIESGNLIGKITFNAPDEISGSDAVLVGASIEALAEDTFDSENNSTALVFKTNTSGAATERMRIQSDGDIAMDTDTLFVDVSEGRVGIGNVEPATALDVTGTVTATALDVDNINIDGNAITSTDTNGDITISPDGTGTVVIDTDLDVDNINIDGNAITSTDTNGNIALTPDGTGEVDISKVDIDGGTIDSTTIGGSTPAAGSFTTVSATGDVDIADKIVHTGDTNTAIRFPAADTVTVETGGSEAMRIDSSGNVGIGVTPSAWSNFKVLEFSDGVYVGTFTGGTTAGYLGTNNYYNGSNYIYKTTDFATRYQQTAGTHQFHTAPSGTAGDPITFTEAMRIDSSGNVGIGETLPTAPLQIKNTSAGASTVGLFLNNSDVTTDTEVRLAFAANTNTDIATDRYSYISAINTSGSNGQALRFATNETGASAVEAMRIDSSGNVGINVVPSAWGSDFKALEIGRVGSSVYTFTPNGNIACAANAYFDGSAFKYAVNGYATNFQNRSSDGTYIWSTAPSGTAGDPVTFTQRMVLDNSGNLDLTNGGGDIIMANGAGIDFSATSNGSGTTSSELLDDYEEGTWTPSLVSSGGGETITYGAQRTGRYTKVGRVVYFQVDVSLATKSGGSGVAEITGLPFTSENNPVTGGATAVFWDGTTTVSPPFGNVVNSSTKIDLRYNNTTTSPQFPWSNVGSTARFLLFGFYTT